MKLSICCSCLEKASEDISKFYFSVLAPIANEKTPYQVMNDKQGIILDTYKDVILNDNSGMLLEWLEAISENGKIFKLTKEILISDNIHVNTLANTYGSRIWLTDNPQDYQNNIENIAAYNIDFLHSDDAASRLNTPYTPVAFDYQQLTNLLINQLSIMMSRKQSVSIEDLHNDELSLRLEQEGYTPYDQTRRGVTGTKGNPGELDILIKSESSVYLSIIEALRESSCGSENKEIAIHLNKLLNNYDTCGLKVNYLITYCEAQNFGNFWNNYITYINDINNKEPFQPDIPQKSFVDTEEEISNFSDIRVGRGIYNRNGRDLEVYHIVCNMKVR